MQGYTPETIAWKRAVEIAGGGFEYNSLFIANNFCKVLRTKSYYSKIKYLLPLLGKGIAATKIPLIDPTPFGAATSSTFLDADFNQTTGVQGNGTTKIYTLPFNNSQLGSSNNVGVGAWYLTISGTIRSVGSLSATSGGRLYALDIGTANERFWWGDGNTATASGVPATANNHYYGQRSSATNRKLYKNAAQIATGSLNSDAVGITDVNASFMGVTGNGNEFYGGRVAFCYYTDGTLTTDEISDFHAVLANFLIGAIGRA